MSFGVIPTGFSRKPLNQILSEIETQMAVVFGPGLIQSPQSPAGQLNGLMADLIATLWEISEDVYSSMDADQAEGINLDRIGKLRILSRGTDETDQELRSAITNQGRSRIDMSDLVRAVRGLEGVTSVFAFVNDLDAPDAHGIPGHTVAVAVVGGDDSQIADQIRDYVVPGVGTYGNTMIQATLDGYCRTIYVVRPVVISLNLAIVVKRGLDQFGCPPPSLTSIKIDLMNSFNEAIKNGEDVTSFTIRPLIEGKYANVEVVSILGAVNPGTPAALPIPIDFFSRAQILDPANVTVTEAP